MYEYSKLNMFEKINFDSEISSNCLNCFFGINEYETLKSCWNALLSNLEWTDVN